MPPPPDPPASSLQVDLIGLITPFNGGLTGLPPGELWNLSGVGSLVYSGEFTQQVFDRMIARCVGGVRPAFAIMNRTAYNECVMNGGCQNTITPMPSIEGTHTTSVSYMGIRLYVNNETSNVSLLLSSDFVQLSIAQRIDPPFTSVPITGFTRLQLEWVIPSRARDGFDDSVAFLHSPQDFTKIMSAPVRQSRLQILRDGDGLDDKERNV